jgi:hypothetical protein
LAEFLDGHVLLEQVAELAGGAYIFRIVVFIWIDPVDSAVEDRTKLFALVLLPPSPSTDVCFYIRMLLPKRTAVGARSKQEVCTLLVCELEL